MKTVTKQTATKAAKDIYSQFSIIIDTFFRKRTKIYSLHKKN